MMNVAVVGLGWWGRIIAGLLRNSSKLAPLMGVDVSNAGSAFCRENGIEYSAEFETALKKLENIVENLGNGDLSLEAALKQYEEGVRMADLCSKRLTEAEKRVEVLLKMNTGKLKAVPFEEKDEDASKGKKKK